MKFNVAFILLSATSCIGLEARSLRHPYGHVLKNKQLQLDEDSSSPSAMPSTTQFPSTTPSCAPSLMPTPSPSTTPSVTPSTNPTSILDFSFSTSSTSKSSKSTSKSSKSSKSKSSKSSKSAKARCLDSKSSKSSKSSSSSSSSSSSVDETEVNVQAFEDDKVLSGYASDRFGNGDAQSGESSLYAWSVGIASVLATSALSAFCL